MEPVILVDSNDTVIGTAEFVWEARGRLLQRRAADRHHSAGLWSACLTAFLFASPVVVGATGCQDAQPAVNTQVREEPTNGQSPGQQQQAPAMSLERVTAVIREQVTAMTDPVRALYDEEYAPLWIDATGAPTESARHALDALRNAARDGLPESRYDVVAMDSLAGLLRPIAARDAAVAGRFDALLSRGLLRYIRDLHVGRIDPRQLGLKLDLPADQHVFPELIRTALAQARIPELVAEQRPPFALYRRLQDALAHYRALAASSRLDQLPALSAAVEPGATWQGLPALRQRLRLFGDLPADAPGPADSMRHEGALIDAVRAFQQRHGLSDDGVIGRMTLAALNVPLEQRIRQIELSLERLRWLPDLSGERLIVVNIPTFHLWAWDAIAAESTPALDMAVIVGSALDTRTPVFAEELDYVIFRPYWNVPRSITRNELLPQIRRDPAYLQRNDMEIVQGQGDDAQPMAPSPENLDLLASGQLRLRQRPGPRNSLGLVKFMFPNDENVYLHDTPADALFSRARRDFSHGCVRVADPVALAEFALQDVPGWDRERIVQAMNAGSSRRVDLPRPITVLLFYTTAIVTPDGTVHFAADIYGHDTRLIEALRS